MKQGEAIEWLVANDRHLEAALVRVNRLVDALAQGKDASQSETRLPEPQPTHPTTSEASSDPLPALVRLCEIFDLSGFERDLLVMAAAPDLDPAFAARCAAAQPDQRPYPTLSLALRALPEADWSALAPNRTLRHWRLIEIGSGSTLATSPIIIEEKVLHFLRGIEAPDERLAGVISPLAPDGPLVPSHQVVAERLADAWAADGPTPVAQLVGGETEGKRSIAAAACGALGLKVNVLRASAVPTAVAELDGLLRLLGREAALARCAILLECDGLAAGDRATRQAVVSLAEQLCGALIISCREQLGLRRRLSLPLQVERPTAREQVELWHDLLSDLGSGLNGQLRALVAQFDLNATAIRSAAVEAVGTIAGDREPDVERLGSALWSACLAQARPSLESLTQRIRPAACWDELVLPAEKKETLADIALHVRHRSKVYDDWGFAARSSRGLGISALFAGPSGTGKTMAAEVLAGELRLDLYRIDLASVVSKYIGETEKNLKQIFDAAEGGGAILLFDEADALFGKRSEVKDSHDRYANIEVSYLLQRMEAYRGLAILTTNMKGALDPAFLRRLRFIIQFPFPETGLRAEIWRHVFPPETPTRGLEPDKLASLAVTGGSIRNIALGAAFLAAEDGVPVTMQHVARAARCEYTKLEKPLTASEIGGW